MHLSTFFTALLAAAPLVVQASPISLEGDKLENVEVEKRGIGRLKYPLYLTTLPKNMTFTLNEIAKNIPKGMEAWVEDGKKLPYTVSNADVEAAKKRGAKGVLLGRFAMQTGGSGFGGGTGSSFNIKYTISGRAPEAAGTAVQKTPGTLTISTSDWGVFGRPDTTTFSWNVGQSGWGTWTAKTPTLVSPDDAFIAVAYVPKMKAYIFSLTTDTDSITKFMRGMVGAVLTLHEVVLSAGSSSLGTVASLGMKAALWVPKAL
ncbi:uncharacterized protein CTRU02_210930 [Colletotrichum truncatum]|uniref:Uncharacterized protein n=1 Tax=Colletotrichum truncatum TaxID=5467 RepID=A0ACC3YRN9_COLTU|nr:uncharacterized protein CTRU02_03586 [Colletotrichum truncatum]KAF6796608.1 hypothetical protein CTRU02_03586 [Colletotrichum truncatum]